MQEFVIHGTRGTMPASAPDTVKYGGYTTCFSLKTSHGIIVFDAGTGISSVCRGLTGSQGSSFTMLFTHLHLDHIIGLPYFEPLYQGDTSISILSDSDRDEDWKAKLKNFASKPYWPVSLSDVNATISFDDLPTDSSEMDLWGARISWCKVPHPQQCLSYRIDIEDKSIVIATDLEIDSENIDPGFISFCKGADYLIYDAQFTPEEYVNRVGWGHGTWQDAVAVARQADVDQLILTHYDPSRTDSGVDEIVESAMTVFPATCGAVSNMILTGS